MAEYRRLRQIRKKASHALIRIIYKDIRGIDICLKNSAAIEVLRHGKDDKSLTYGEVISSAFESLIFDAIRLLIGKVDQLVFYDLGSGTGKACLTAALCLPAIARSIGLEINPSLHIAASQCHTRLLHSFTECTRASTQEKSSPLNKGSGNGRKINSTVGHVLSANELAAFVLAQLQSILRDASVCLEARLANAVCLKLGQKTFKASFRPSTNGSFHRFLLSRSEFDVYNIDGSIAVQEAQEARLVGESEEVANTAVLSPDEKRFSDDDLDNDKGDDESELVAVHDRLLETLKGDEVLTSFGKLADIHFEEADIFERQPPWYTEADIAFCASLLFSHDMLRRLCCQLVHMRPGSVFISLKEMPLEGDELSLVTLVNESFYQFSWQKAKVYMYRIR